MAVPVGPATDGGYYLIGSRIKAPEIFPNMPWGTDKVFEMTHAQLTQRGYKYAVLPAWFDVDTPEDLHHLKHYLAQNPHSLPATRKTMASCLPIGKT